MPSYDYLCNHCGHKFEAFQSMSDDVLEQCPNCGEPSLRRLISGGSGLIFKGSGFYLTDYKNKSVKNDKTQKTAKESGTKKVESKTKPAENKK